MKMPRDEGMSETGQIVVAILSTVAIAALTKWGMFPDEGGGSGGGGGGGGGGPNIYIGGTHTHHSRGVDALEGVEEDLDRIDERERTGGRATPEKGKRNVGRMIIQNRGDGQTIIPFADAFTQPTGGLSFVVVLSHQWEDDRYIDVAYYNQSQEWHMGETVHMGGHNGCQHWLVTVGPGTFLRILTNRDVAYQNQAVDKDVALQYMRPIVPHDTDTVMPYDRQLNLFNKGDGRRRARAQYSLQQFADLNNSRPDVTLAVYCPKRAAVHSPQ